MKGLFKTTNTNLKRILILLLFFCSIFAQKPVAVKDSVTYLSLPELKQQLDELFKDPNFANASWGINIQSLKKGDIIYQQNADKLFIPASLVKLFTSSASLLLLGSQYTYETGFFYRGKIENNSLKGDLIIRGKGDPAISGRFTKNNVTAVIESWADSLIERGVYEITGNLIGDDNLFDEQKYGRGWEMDYTNQWFASPSSALAFNENLVEINIEGTEYNKPAKISINPDTKYITLIKKVITGYENSEPIINISKNEGSKVITISGKIAEKGAQKVYYPIQIPTNYFLSVVKEVLENKGIRIRGYAADVDLENSKPDYTTLLNLFNYYSPPMHNLIFEMNKNSNNFYAEQILKSIGLEINEYGSTENGIKALKGLMEVMGINSENMIIADGSGLSRLNLLTPRQVTRLLSYMYVSDEFGSFLNSLPIGGVDGTLSERMKRSKAEKNVRAKTGTLPGVVSMAGYINSADSEPITFCIIINNFLVPSSLATNICDAVCSRLANFKRK